MRSSNRSRLVRKSTSKYSLSEPKIATSPSTSTISPLWRDPLVWILSTVSVSVVAAPLFIDLWTPRIISIAASDSSGSALQSFLSVRNEHHQALKQMLKDGDWQTVLEFADQAEVVCDRKYTTSFIQRNNSCQLEFSQAEQQSQQVAPPVGKLPGTSLYLLLEEINTQIMLKRKQGLNRPGVVTIDLHEAEPGPGQPSLDFKNIATQIKTITDHCSVVAIIGPTGKLRDNLNEALENNAQVEVCPFNEASACVERTFEKGRQLTH